MTTELLLFWLAVVGDLVLLYYTGKVGLLAARRFRKGDRAGAARYACSALAIAMITGLFPWALMSGARDIGRVALLICILTPFVVSMAKLWPFVKERIARTPMLAADVLILGMVLAFLVSGDWAWFWAASILMAVAWIVGRKVNPPKPRLAVSEGEQLEPPRDTFEEFYGPERDITNPYQIGHR